MPPPSDAPSKPVLGLTSEPKARGANRTTKVAGKLKVLPDQPAGAGVQTSPTPPTAPGAPGSSTAPAVSPQVLAQRSPIVQTGPVVMSPPPMGPTSPLPPPPRPRDFVLPPGHGSAEDSDEDDGDDEQEQVQEEEVGYNLY